LGINRSHIIASPNPYFNVPDFAIMHTKDKMLMEYILISCQVGGWLEEGLRNVTWSYVVGKLQQSSLSLTYSINGLMECSPVEG
jgi:hypothetical protein